MTKPIETPEDLRVFIVSSFTAQPIEKSLQYWGDRLGPQLKIAFAPVGQIFGQLMDAGSNARENRGLNVLLVRAEDMVRIAVADDLEKSASSDLMEGAAAEIESAVAAYSESTRTPLLIVICPASPKILSKLSSAASNFEQRLVNAGLQHGHTRVITPSQIQRWYPINDYYDPFSDSDGLIPYFPEMYTAIGTTVARYIYALTHAEHYKVIVVDCDNTLWRGLVAEDGCAGITIDKGHKLLQRMLREQATSGRLVCLCSRNDEADVWNVFENHPDMQLKRGDIADWRINYESKSENLKALAASLGLHLDSFIFLDDDPVMCSEISAILPNVLSIRIPTDPLKLEAFLDHLWVLDKPVVTHEDAMRTTYYHQNKLRRNAEVHFSTYEEFLQRLGVTVEVNAMRQEDIRRVSQLLIRTNQFNSNRLILSEDDLVSVLATGTRLCFVVRAQDRFGDYGVIGCVISHENEVSLTVDCITLSCRALGRGIESMVVEHLRRLARERARQNLNIVYRATDRNKIVETSLRSVHAVKVVAQEETLLFQITATSIGGSTNGAV